MNDSKYSLESLNEFLEKLPTLKIVTENTAKNLKTVPRLLEFTEGQTFDIRNINIEELIKNYEQKNVSISPVSLKSYRSRIQQAIKTYTAFLENPEGLKEENAMNSSRQQQSARRKQAASKGIEIKTFSLPIPLRSDLILKMENLPLDLSEEEAERIAKIVKSYALQSLT